jgi:toxin ParE1/3/4
MRSLRWEADAYRQYQDALAYIAAQSPLAAERLAWEIAEKVDMLPRFPAMGRKGRVTESRELVVLHSRQLYP